ncbi:unnamed protein product, partial [Iphiclides podalirius]
MPLVAYSFNVAAPIRCLPIVLSTFNPPLGEGDQQPDVQPGDVIIVLQQKPHDVFQRTGDDLLMKHDITLTEALCGFEFVVKHLDGRDLLIRHAAGEIIKPGDLKGIQGEGEDVEEVNMMEYTASERGRGREEAYASDDEEAMHGGHGMQCSHQ